MSTRTFEALGAGALLLLAACVPDAAVESPADEDNLIECALGGAGSFARECVVERSRSEEGLLLIVRHPDGGFRRFVITAEEPGLATADGAELATLTARESGIEAAVGGDRYRFPDTITADGAD